MTLILKCVASKVFLKLYAMRKKANGEKKEKKKELNIEQENTKFCNRKTCIWQCKCHLQNLEFSGN